MKIKVQNLKAKQDIIEADLSELQIVEEDDHMHSAHFIIKNSKGWELGRYLTKEMAQKVFKDMSLYFDHRNIENTYFEMPQINDNRLMREFSCFMKSKDFKEEDTGRTRRISYLCVMKPEYKEFLWEDIIIKENSKEFDLFDGVEMSKEDKEYFTLQKQVSKLMTFIISERVKQNISRKDFAKAIGVSVRQLQNYENFKSVPKVDVLLKMLNILGFIMEIVPKEKYL